MNKQIFPDNFPKAEIIELLNKLVEKNSGIVQSDTENNFKDGIIINIYSNFLEKPLVYKFQTEKTLNNFVQGCGIYLLSNTNLAYKIERIFTDNHQGQMLEIEF